MKHKLLTVFFILLTSYLPAQYYGTDWIVKNGDTIECEDVVPAFHTLLGCSIRYKLNGEKIKLEGTEECSAIPVCYNGSVMFDLVPLDADKPDGKSGYFKRIVEGQIQVNEYEFNTSSSTTSGNTTTITTRENNVYYAMLPDGKWYSITKKNYQDYIQPVLLKCKESKSAIANTKMGILFDPFQVISFITIYNYTCEAE